MGALPVIAFTAIVVFAGLSFFFSLAESSLISLSKWQVRKLSEHQPGTGGIVAKLLSDPQDLLATLVLGNTIANAGLLGTALWMALDGHWPLGNTIVGCLILVLFGCEVLPKTMAVRNPEAWAQRMAHPLQAVLASSRPFSWLAQRVNFSILKSIKNVPAQTALTDADYQELLEMAYQTGTLAESEKEIILQIISLDRRTAREVMKSRADVDMLSDDLPIEDMISVARAKKHSRMPIYDESPDTIVGILNTRALLLSPSHDLAEAIEFPSFVPETMNLLQLLRSLQRQQRGMAVVLDEFGGVAGVVTTDDIWRELVGKVRADREGKGLLMERLGLGKWRLSAGVRLDDFRREYPALPDIPEVETMGGLLMTLLDKVPGPMESATLKGLRITAQVADERHVTEILAEVVK